MMQKNSSRRKGRLLFIDVARTFAILLALLSHFIGSFGMPSWFGSAGENYPFITSMATPMFIFMFGFMMEYAYVSKAYKLWTSEFSKRIYIRSFQCYVGFVLTSFAALLGGHVDVLTFFKSLVMLEPTRYSNILLIYSLYLLIFPSIVLIRIKYGVAALIYSTLILYFLTLLAPIYKDVSFDFFGYFMNNTFGVGRDVGGPSAIFGLIFVFSGMIVASALRKCELGSLKNFYIYLGFFIFFSSFAIILVNDLSSVRSIKDYLTLYSYGHFRGLNNYNYFLLGTLFSCFNLGVICVFFELLIRVNSLPSVLTSVGRASLFAFAFGNILLNIFTNPLAGFDPGVSIFLFFITVIAGARFLNKLPYYNAINRLLNLNFSKDRVS